MRHPPGFIEETLRIAINNINDDREHLGLEYSLSLGFITQSTFEEARAQYLIRSNISHQELVERAKVLKKLIGDRLNSEIIKTAFRCTIEEADKAFAEIMF